MSMFVTNLKTLGKSLIHDTFFLENERRSGVFIFNFGGAVAASFGAVFFPFPNTRDRISIHFYQFSIKFLPYNWTVFNL